MRSDFLKQIVLGIVLAAVLIPAPTQAQWTVFDPSNYSIQIKRHIEDLSRWMETVNQYMRMYENAVGQLTHLQGMLRTADELPAHDKRMRKFISYWGQAIRLTFRVKNQLVNLVTGAARAIMNIEQRLRNGIFDPEANKRDFAEYLRYGIGRTAQDAEAEVERLKRMDNQLERIIYDHQRTSEQLAQLNSHIVAKKEELERLKNCDDCTDKDRDMEQLSFEIAKLEEQAAKSEGEVSRLFDLKAKRVEEIYKTEEERTRFGRTIITMNKAWRGISDATIKLRESLQDGK
jgi:conjugal transfer/entry exclusion protein